MAAEGGHLFDPEGFAADVEATLDDSTPFATQARAGFLAGLLSTWTLGPGVTPTALERASFLRISRESLAQSYLSRRPAPPERERSTT